MNFEDNEDEYCKHSEQHIQRFLVWSFWNHQKYFVWLEDMAPEVDVWLIRIEGKWQEITLGFHEGSLMKDLICYNKDFVFIHENKKIIDRVAEIPTDFFTKWW